MYIVYPDFQAFALPSHKDKQRYAHVKMYIHDTNGYFIIGNSVNDALAYIHMDVSAAVSSCGIKVAKFESQKIKRCKRLIML